MLKRRKLATVDIILVAMLVITAVASLSVFRLKANVTQEKVRTETRLRTAEQNLASAEKEANLETLTRALEQARSALGENPLPSEARVRAFVGELAQSAQRSGVTIVTWNHSDTTAVLKTRRYPAVTHSLNVQGKPDSLASFVEAVTRAPVRPFMKNMSVSLVALKEEVWRLGLELVIYHRD